MKRARLIIKLLNLVNSVLITLLMLKLLHLFAFLNPFAFIHFVVLAIIIYAIKMWVEMAYSIPDPIKENRITKALYYSGLGFVSLGLLSKFMHWPYQNMLLLFGATLLFSSAVISFFVAPKNRESSPDILDDLE